MVVVPDGLDPTEKRHLVYDAWNRLVGVRADDGGDPGDLIATYRYNGLNHRISKIDHRGAQAVTTHYYYNAGWQVVEERRAVGAGPAQVHTQYLWCPSYIDTPVLRWRDTSEVPDQDLNETLYYTVDANKNVTALVDAANGNVVERYLYDPYGRVTVLDNDWNEIAWSASRKNEILFTGYRYNPTPGSGTYQARNRESSPTLGRFMQRDPLAYVDGGNLYAGCFVMWGGVDSWGLNSIPDADIGLPGFSINLVGGITWQPRPMARFIPASGRSMPVEQSLDRMRRTDDGYDMRMLYEAWAIPHRIDVRCNSKGDVVLATRSDYDLVGARMTGHRYESRSRYQYTNHPDPFQRDIVFKPVQYDRIDRRYTHVDRRWTQLQNASTFFRYDSRDAGSPQVLLLEITASVRAAIDAQTSPYTITNRQRGRWELITPWVGIGPESVSVTPFGFGFAYHWGLDDDPRFKMERGTGPVGYQHTYMIECYGDENTGRWDGRVSRMRNLREHRHRVELPERFSVNARGSVTPH